VTKEGETHAPCIVKPPFGWDRLFVTKFSTVKLSMVIPDPDHMW